jgi:ABC-2 type transport system permease protein
MIKLTGAKVISNFILRRDRISILIWVGSFVLLTAYVALMFPTLYPTDIKVKEIIDTLSNPAMIAMLGPYYGATNYVNHGAVYAAEMLILVALTVATMNILLVTKHTRKDEEEGRLEVIRSLPVGKTTVLFSTLSVYVIVNILIGLFVGVALILTGDASFGWNGSLLYGAALTVTGIYFAAVTGLFAQLNQTSRGTSGYAFGFLGIMYLIRAIGDINSEALSLISPLGLISRTKTYVSNTWWPILIVLIEAIIIAYIATRLNALRDLNASFIPVKPGRKKASKLLLSPLGLAFKNQKSAIIAWAIGVMVLGMSYGSVLGDIETFISGNELYEKMLSVVGGTASFVDRFMVMLLAVIAMVGAIPVIQMMNKLRYEEKHNHLEHLLGRAVSRRQLIMNYVTLSVIVSMIMSFSGTLGLYMAGAQVVESPLVFGDMLMASFAYLPAIWVFVALSVLLLGFIPNALKLIWLYLGFAFISVYLGGILGLPEWAVKLTPFGYVQKIPVESYNVVSSIILVIISLVLIYVGNAKYRLRDLEG